MKNKSIIIIITSLIIVIISCYFFFCKKSNQISLTVGMMNGWAPFMNINNKGNMEGFDVDVVKEIEKIINQKIIIKDLGSLSSLFIALEQESVVAIFSGLDVTAKRKTAYDYVLYGSNETKINECCVIINNKGPNNELDLINNHYKIGLEAATSWESTLNKYPLIQKVYSNSISDMLLQLEQNKIDCFIIDPMQCHRLKKNMPYLKYFVIDIDESIKIDGIGIFIKKHNNPIKNLFSNAIDALIKNGQIDTLIQKWNLA